jgi:hypothetical protein
MPRHALRPMLVPALYLALGADNATLPQTVLGRSGNRRTDQGDIRCAQRS